MIRRSRAPGLLSPEYRHLSAVDDNLRQYLTHVTRRRAGSQAYVANMVRSPDSHHPVPVENPLVGKQMQVFRLRLRDQHAVEGVSVHGGQLTGTLRMLE